MADKLITHLEDSYDVETVITFPEKRVELAATDEWTKQWFRLVFDTCTVIKITYSDEEPNWVALNDLANGVTEVEDQDQGERHFQIHYSDESILDIVCKQFSMTPI